MPVRARSLLLVAGLSLVLAACQKDGASAQDADVAAKAMPVTVAPVRARSLPYGVSVSGAVAPVEEMQLGVEVSGLRVTALHVDVGARVERGQRLLELDHRTLDSDLAQAEAALREAEAGA
ncbi:MAG: efflux RND transporter periplasmic adaptor subunit, partial [Lysobacteraceae bacterium]